MTEPWTWSLTEAAAHLRAGDISCSEYTNALLAQIEKLEPALQAWARLDRKRALREAAKCTADAHRNHWRGPLHGIPVGIKDNFDTAGLETCANSQLLNGNIPQHDAIVVQRLRAAGGLVPGKT